MLLFHFVIIRYFFIPLLYTLWQHIPMREVIEEMLHVADMSLICFLFLEIFGTLQIHRIGHYPRIVLPSAAPVDAVDE